MAPLTIFEMADCRKPNRLPNSACVSREAASARANGGVSDMAGSMTERNFQSIACSHIRRCEHISVQLGPGGQQSTHMEKRAFGIRLKALLEAHPATDGKTQAEIGKLIGVSQPMLSHMLHGRKLPSHETAIRIAGALGVSVQWLMTGKGPRAAGGESRDLLDISSLDQQSQDAMRALLRALSPRK